MNIPGEHRLHHVFRGPKTQMHSPQAVEPRQSPEHRWSSGDGEVLGLRLVVGQYRVGPF